MHLCTPASFRPLLAETPLPSARTFVSIHYYYEHFRFSYRGLSPHKLMPMTGAQCAGINRHGVENERVLH